MKICVYSAKAYDQPVLQAAAGEHEMIFTAERLGPDTAHFASGCQAVALFTSDDASAPVLAKLHDNGVRFVALRSVGYDHIDLNKAASLGMRVANVPGYSPYSVAEHAVALLMAMNRKIVQGQHLMSVQDFRIESLKGFDVHGKTVGVIGTGKIGLAFARIMLGFGAKVLAFDPIINDDAVDLGIRFVSMDQLLKESDIVSVHCPLKSATHHLISALQLNSMKNGAILINTSRGAVVNTTDLIDALDRGRLGGACLDVYEFEKGLFFEDHRNEVIHDVNFARLRSFSNVIITSHQGFLTTDAISQIANTTVANLDCWENDLPCPNDLIAVEKHESDSPGRRKSILSL